jgi:hypothetical protein
MKVKVKLTANHCETGEETVKLKFDVARDRQDLVIKFLYAMEERHNGNPTAWRELAKQLEALAENFTRF